MNQAFVRAMTAASVAVGVVLGGAMPAYAALGDCPDDYVCMWEDSGFSGDMWVRYRLNSVDKNKFEIDGWDGDNEISSIANNTNLYLIVFEDDNWNGATRCFNPNSSASSLGSTWNDDIESFVLHTDCQI